jgi:pyridoxine kinase
MRRGHGLRRIRFGAAALNILSIQSHVAYGHVGNSAAVFALQRLGVEVWPIHTVQLSNHTGYETARGRATDAAHIRELTHGLRERGALARCDGVLSGYIASAAIGEAVLGAVAEVRRANPRALYCCDPVIGDAGRGAFVKPEVAEFMRAQAVPAADIVTPNHFELERIAGRTIGSLADAVAALEGLRRLGPKTALVTSFAGPDTPADAIELIACDGAACHRLRTPKLAVAAHGAGDLIAALFLAHHLRSGSAAVAMARATASVFGVLKRTAELGAAEMALIEAQDELVNPGADFRAEPL